MTPLDFIFWAAEALLEFLGADWAARRKVWPLSVYLYSRFAADVFCFWIYQALGQNAFYWADWWQRAIQYPLMAVLLAYAIGNVLHELQPLIGWYALTLGTLWAGWWGLWIASGGLNHATSQRLLRLELGFNMTLCSVLCLALAMRKEVKAPWGAISAGILIQVGSEAVLTLGLLKGLDTSKLYPLGAIAALGMWVWAVRPKYQLKEARLNLGVR